jgi:hypothetical protein
MTRLGTMARWPHEMREELNVRLYRGEGGWEAQFRGLKLDGLRNLAGMPPQELRVCPEANSNERSK